MAALISRFKNRVHVPKKCLIKIEFLTDSFSKINDTIVFISQYNCKDDIKKLKGVCVYDSSYVGIVDNENVGMFFYNSKCLIELDLNKFDCDTSEWKFIEIYKLDRNSFKECDNLHYEKLL